MLESEFNKWKDVIPTMMSDEEDIGDNTFRVHHQEWCSQEMTDLLDEFDRRADVVMKKMHPQKAWVVGTPLKVNATKDWMSREDSDAQ